MSKGIAIECPKCGEWEAFCIEDAEDGFTVYFNRCAHCKTKLKATVDIKVEVVENVTR